MRSHWFTYLWRRFRNHEEIEFLNGRIESLSEDSAALWKARDEAREETDKVRTELLAALDRERSTRIQVEALSVSRQRHIDDLQDEVKWLREEVNTLMRDRLKSLDLVNQRLIENQVKTEPPPPDMKQFQQQALQKAGLQAVTAIRQVHRDVDAAILQKMYPQMFAKPSAAPPPITGVVTNAPIPQSDPNPAA